MEIRCGKCLCGEPEKVVVENGKQILERCPLYVKLIGQNPQTGADIDEWRCSLAWIPILLVENIQQARQGGAATESMRNEIVKRMDSPPVMLVEKKVKLIGGNGETYNNS